MSKSDDPTFDQWGPIGGDGDHSASGYNYVRECVGRLGWDGDDQFAHLLREGLPTVDLLEDYFSIVPAWLEFLIARGHINETDAAALVEFEQFLTNVICPQPWGDERDALDHPLWTLVRDHAARLLTVLPPQIAEP